MTRPAEDDTVKLSGERDKPDTRSAWWLKLAFVLTGLALWFTTQWLLRDRQLEGDGIIDMPLLWTAPLHGYLRDHRTATDGLLIVSSLIIDCLGIFLLTWSIVGPSIRPFLGLLILFSLRQICQALCALLAPPEMLWPDGQPGSFPRLPDALGGFEVPTLLVTYDVANDFFFSGHTALAVYGAIELARLGRKWLVALAVVIAVFQSMVVLVLRAHWTMDVFAGAITALFVAQLAAWLCALL